MKCFWKNYYSKFSVYDTLLMGNPEVTEYYILNAFGSVALLYVKVRLAFELVFFVGGGGVEKNY